MVESGADLQGEVGVSAENPEKADQPAGVIGAIQLF
jgi:hypothetical protein